MTTEIDLTEDARVAQEINRMHGCIVAAETTAKMIAAEIGEKLIEQKKRTPHGKFMDWVRDNCSFSQRTAEEYRKVALAKSQSAENFNRCTSIREVLDLGKTPKAPKRKLEEPTLDELRVVRKLQAVIYLKMYLRHSLNSLYHRLIRQLQLGIVPTIHPITKATDSMPHNPVLNSL